MNKTKLISKSITLFGIQFRNKFSLFSKSIIKKKERTETSTNPHENSVLDMLSGEFDINDGKSIEQAVHQQVTELEKLKYYHNQNVKRLANKLIYIQENLGVHNEFKNRTKMYANDLIDMTPGKIIELVKNIANNKNQKNKYQTETDLLILLSHLVFRNLLTADLFSRIIMKIGLVNLKHIHQKLMEDPEAFIKDWNKNGRSRIVCGLSLTSRYKFLKDYESSQKIILNEFQNIWMKELLNKNSILTNNDIKNMINTFDRLIDYGYLVTCMIKTRNFDIIYSFWENHPNDGLIKEWLENEIANDKNNKINPYRKFIISVYTNAGVSTVSKWRLKILDISKKLKLSILNIDSINKSKFYAFTELLLNEMSDEMDNDYERREYFNEIKKQYHQLRNELNERDDYKYIVGSQVKTSNF